MSTHVMMFATNAFLKDGSGRVSAGGPLWPNLTHQEAVGSMTASVLWSSSAGARASSVVSGTATSIQPPC
jgi:hypothetical protein